jgi:hypothetical protein
MVALNPAASFDPGKPSGPSHQGLKRKGLKRNANVAWNALGQQI